MSKLIPISNCKNCGTQVEHHNFCPDCGAKKITKRITFRNLTEELTEKYFNIDNSLVRTIKDLMINPHDVIDGFINGVRKKYINVISYFLISITLNGLTLFSLKKYFNQPIVDLSTIKEDQEWITTFYDMLYDYQGISSFALIPLYALISKKVFSNYKKYNFTEHIVINMYINAHVAIVMFVPIMILLAFGFQYKDISFYSILFIFIYSIFTFKSLYHLNWKQTTLKTLKFLLILFVLSLILFFVAIIIGIAMAAMEGKFNNETAMLF
ncbi:DUF3667 domain-containing protein [Aquimarina spongiae]|uniref:Uncharacterized protein n=1 Tax=Aquimarina spongiae TaxID=570521 RepID=A0A1M6H9Y5_9FLAO|nr:DUF3667 domain-containing protein [Aquimarina spongiae]SHJ18933.1 Protein of unknown function [Aquimarina spongiae]